MSRCNSWNNEEVMFEIYIIKYLQLNGIDDDMIAIATWIQPAGPLNNELLTLLALNELWCEREVTFSNITQTGTVKRIWGVAIVFQ
ncbi:hypothetical protein T4B_14371, partial [Trichinella pseudospiralis]|uniref:Uncharacterized protein n=1 Tax=Trichinella pseudospiralis TaxID=6337 RepID=A0A0V0XU88_TRIPS